MKADGLASSQPEEPQGGEHRKLGWLWVCPTLSLWGGPLPQAVITCPLWFWDGCLSTLQQPLCSERGPLCRCVGGWQMLSPPPPEISALALQGDGTGSGLGWHFGGPLPLAAWEATSIHIVLNGFPSIFSVDPPNPESISPFHREENRAQERKRCAKGHTAKKVGNWDLNPILCWMSGGWTFDTAQRSTAGGTGWTGREACCCLFFRVS